MVYKNGYKVVYEIAADGKRTFYATKSNAYPATDDVELASFTDAEYAGKTIYEYKGEFYVSTGAVPAYNEDGTPKDQKIAGFEKLFVEEAAATPAEASEPVVEEPVTEPEVEEDEPVANEGDGETEVDE